MRGGGGGNGGGGGYSGGGGGSGDGSFFTGAGAGGGGGSFVDASGTLLFATAGARSGDGEVDIAPVATPEPGTFGLAFAALALIGALRRKRRG